MKATISVHVKLPQLPNFVLIEGMDGSIPIADLSELQIRELGLEWTEALVRHARERRSAAKPPFADREKP